MPGAWGWGEKQSRALVVGNISPMGLVEVEVSVLGREGLVLALRGESSAKAGGGDPMSPIPSLTAWPWVPLPSCPSWLRH